MEKRYVIKFRYADAYSGWKWREQECVSYAKSESAAERKCINLYGLEEDTCMYEIVSVEETE